MSYPQHYSASLARSICVAIVCFLIFGTVTHFTGGGNLSVDTSLSDLVPADNVTSAKSESVNRAQEFAESSIVFVLSSDDEMQLDQATEFFNAGLDQSPELVRRIDFLKLSDTLVELLTPHRFSLLSIEDRNLLLAGDAEVIFEESLAELYSPGGKWRALEIGEDPLNVFGRWLESMSTSVSNPLSEAHTGRVVNIRLSGNYNGVHEQDRLMSFFGNLESQTMERFPEVTMLKSGVLFFASESAKNAQQDINVVSMGSLCGLFFLLVVVFRSGWPVVMPLASIAFGVICAFSLVHWLYGSVHVFTIVFGASLIGIVIDYSIHFFYHASGYLQPQAAGKDENSGGVSGSLYRALILSLLTSALGFAALLFSSVPSLQKIAVFSITGLVSAWLVVLALGPWAARRVVIRSRWIQWFTQILARTAAQLARKVRGGVGAILVILALAAVITLSDSQDDPRSFVELPKALLAETEEVNRLVMSLEPGRFLLVEGENQEAFDEALDQVYRQAPNSLQLNSVSDWLPSTELAKSNYNLLKDVYSENGPARRLLRVVGADPESVASLTTEYGKAAGSQIDIPVIFDRIKDFVLPQVFKTEEGVAGYVMLNKGEDVDQLATLASTLEGVSYINTVGETTAQLRTQRIASLLALVVSYLVLGVLLSVLYRYRAALKMLSVPALATLFTLLVLSVLDQPLTLFHTMALFMVLGLGMDYVIFLSEMRGNSERTRQSIVLSALTTLISFGLLSLSSIPVAKAFGLTVLLGNTFNLWFALAIFASYEQDTNIGTTTNGTTTNSEVMS